MILDTSENKVYTVCGGGQMPTEAQKRAARKYDDTHTMQLKLKLNLNTDADIIEYLKNHPNKQGLIKQLLREHMNGNP